MNSDFENDEELKKLFSDDNSILVQNIKGTSNKKPPSEYKSWQDFWEKKTGLKAKHDVGGHVKKYNSNDNSWYIADITEEQNSKDEPYEYNSVLVKLHD